MKSAANRNRTVFRPRVEDDDLGGDVAITSAEVGLIDKLGDRLSGIEMMDLPFSGGWGPNVAFC